jgi:hypothetical protein
MLVGQLEQVFGIVIPGRVVVGGERCVAVECSSVRQTKVVLGNPLPEHLKCHVAELGLCYTSELLDLLAC